MNRAAFVLTLTAASVLATPAGAQTPPLAPSAAIARLFTAKSIDPSWFSSLFVATVPVDRVQGIVADVLATLGPYGGIAPNGKAFTVKFARGTVQATASLNDSGAFNFLVFSRMQSDAALQRVIALFQTADLPNDWFSSSLLAMFPAGYTPRQTVVSLTSQFGAFVSAAPAPDGSYDLTFAKGHHVSCLIFLSSDGKIDSLNFIEPS
jgi:hypothetical protein